MSLQLLKWGALASSGCSIPCKWDAKMITKKMAEMVELPFEVLSTIITILAMSSDGARGLARASATCKMLMTHARQPDVLRVVNFQNLVPSHGCEEHFHQNGLLFSCVRVGNLAAEYLLGKAVLYRMAFPGNQTPLFAFLSSNGISQHQRLVRSFLCGSSCEDIAAMYFPLFCYIGFSIGLHAGRASGILQAFTELSYCEIVRFRISRGHTTLPGVQNILGRWRPESASQSLKERVLLLFDELFPPSPA